MARRSRCCTTSAAVGGAEVRSEQAAANESTARLLATNRNDTLRIEASYGCQQLRHDGEEGGEERDRGERAAQVEDDPVEDHAQCDSRRPDCDVRHLTGTPWTPRGGPRTAVQRRHPARRPGRSARRRRCPETRRTTWIRSRRRRPSSARLRGRTPCRRLRRRGTWPGGAPSGPC